jgi:hypothetical protein
MAQGCHRGDKLQNERCCDQKATNGKHEFAKATFGRQHLVFVTEVALKIAAQTLIDSIVVAHDGVFTALWTFK